MLEKLQESLFFSLIFFLVLKASPILNEYGLGELPGRIKLVIGYLFLISFIMKKNTRKTWFTFIIFGAICFIVVYFSKEYNIMIYYLIIFGMNRNKISNYLKVSFYALTVSSLVVVLFSGLELIPEVVTVRLGEERNSLGFNLPVTLPAFLFSINSLYLILKKNSLKFTHVSTLFIINVIVFYYTDGRTGMIFSTLLIFGAYFLTKSQRIKWVNTKLVYMATVLSYILANLVSIGASIFYVAQNSNWATLNELLTGRFYWWSKYWNTYTISPFGQELTRISSTARLQNSSAEIMILDNSFLSILLEYGLLFYILLSVLYFVLLKELKKQDQMIILWVLLVTFWNGVPENALLYIETNMMIILFASLIKRKGEVISLEQENAV